MELICTLVVSFFPVPQIFYTLYKKDDAQLAYLLNPEDSLFIFVNRHRDSMHLLPLAMNDYIRNRASQYEKYMGFRKVLPGHDGLQTLASHYYTQVFSDNQTELFYSK